MKRLFFLLLIFLFCRCAFAQIMGSVAGVVKDRNTQKQIEGAVLRFVGKDTVFISSDEDGRFTVRLPVGKYNLEATRIGYSASNQYNLNLTSGNAQILQIELNQSNQALREVVVTSGKSVRAADMLTPLSTQRLTSEEIQVNPGGNFDVSKVIQVLPGVVGGTTPSRNDIIVRGGGPSENVYYLDGIEIPVLNHFQTQGASGGATGILNVAFIQDVQLTSSAFNSKYGNALASTIVIKQRNGNPDKLSGNIRLSGSEFAVMGEGPLGKKTTFMASARRSYLQFLFKLLDLPIRPDYYDFQYKVNHKIDNKSELNFIGIGAIDNFRLAVSRKSDANTEYIIRANPLIKQWNYTLGGSYKRLIDNGYFTVSLSRNVFFNGADRYENNASKTGNKLYSLSSHEVENKLKIEMNKYLNGWKYGYGLDIQRVRYDADIFNIVETEERDFAGNITKPEVSFSTTTTIDFSKLGAYVQAAKYFFDEKMLVSGGLRTDVNSFTTGGWNALRTISPRISFSYILNDKWNISGSVGSYYKIPAYTMLGFRDSIGGLVNKKLTYMNAIHYTLGAEFVPRNDLRLTIEAFVKNYRDYPVSLTTGVSYANIGTDFSAVGSDSYSSVGKGRVYGVEAYMQQKLVKRMFFVMSATLFKSEFSGLDKRFRPSTWDYGFVVASTFGYKFGNNWDLGLKYRIAGGQPYTPFDMAVSKAMYLTTGKGVSDYSQLNTQRLSAFKQLDARIDKKLNLKNVSLDLFLDFQNILGFRVPYIPRFTFERTEDNSGFKTTDGQALKADGSNGIPLILEQQSGTVIPSIGVIFEF